MNRIILIAIVILLGYSFIGVGTRVEEIKNRSPAQIEKNGYTILRYEGYEYGSWNHHGGKVWYHITESTNPNIRYRMYVCLWGNDLQFYYAQSENISNVQVKIP